jgi:hypothetical protein
MIAMQMKEKIELKEASIRLQLETLRKKLNDGRMRYNQNPNDWQYYPSIVYTESKLEELLSFFETQI